MLLWKSSPPKTSLLLLMETLKRPSTIQKRFVVHMEWIIFGYLLDPKSSPNSQAAMLQKDLKMFFSSMMTAHSHPTSLLSATDWRVQSGALDTPSRVLGLIPLREHTVSKHKISSTKCLVSSEPSLVCWEVPLSLTVLFLCGTRSFSSKLSMNTLDSLYPKTGSSEMPAADLEGELLCVHLFSSRPRLHQRSFSPVAVVAVGSAKWLSLSNGSSDGTFSSLLGCTTISNTSWRAGSSAGGSSEQSSAFSRRYVISLSP